MQRNKSRIYRIALITAFIVLFGLSLMSAPVASPVLAQSCLDITPSMYVWPAGFRGTSTSAASAVGWDGTKWYHNDYSFAGDETGNIYRAVTLVYDFGAPTTITSGSFHYDLTTGTSSGAQLTMFLTDAGGTFVQLTQVGVGGNDGTNRTFTLSSGASGARYLVVQVTSDYTTGARTGSVSVYQVQFCGGLPTPTPTATPTATRTATPTPTVPPVGDDDASADAFPECALLGRDSSRFRNLPGLWSLMGTASNPDETTEGLELRNGSAEMYLSLSRMRQYKLEIVAHVTDNWHEGLFRVQIGSSAWTQFRLAAEPGHQTFLLPPANYMPNQVEAGADIYTLTLLRNSIIDATPGIEEQSDQTVVIDYICLADSTTEPGSNDPNVASGLGGILDNIFGIANIGACPEENASGTGDLLADVSQSLSFMWNCALRSALGGINKLGMDTAQFLAFFRMWLSLLTGGIIDGTGGSALAIAQWLASLFQNGETAMSNAVIGGLQSIGLLSTDGSATVWEGTLGSMGEVATSSINNLNDIWNLLGSVFNLVVAQVTAWFQSTINTLGGLWATANSAINQEPIPLPGIPACNDDADIIVEACLPIFMIDNTILGDSSILAPLLPLLKGAVGFGLIWWAAYYVRGQLKGAAEDEA